MHCTSPLAPLGVVIVLLFQSGASRTEARSVPRLFDVTTAHGVFDGAPVGPSDTFAPDDTPIYVWFRCEGCTIGTVIGSSWFYLDQEPPVRLASGSVTVNSLEDFGEFHCDLRGGRPWPAGTYRIELRVDDAPAAELLFRVVVNTQ